MPDDTDHALYTYPNWVRPAAGARYLQLARHLSEAIQDGRLAAGTQLPPERQLAALSGLSRVTVRKAVANLAREGLIRQRQGAGSFVRATPPRLEQSLSTMVSFSENLRQRGLTPGSQIIERGLFMPTGDEVLALGLTPATRVARIKRLRFADGVPMAVETSTLPAKFLPRPQQVTTSLYDVLRAKDRAPVRAVQRVSARNLSAAEAELLSMGAGDAVLAIERTAYLAHGRPVEFTRGLYRSDMYDFVAELQTDG